MKMQKVIREIIEKEMQEIKRRIQKCYYSKSGLNEAEKYIKGLMSRAERRNGLTIKNGAGKQEYLKNISSEPKQRWHLK